jgi:acyl-CoA reductase-like NAD-dependent aldehyde dehydrogenase
MAGCAEQVKRVTLELGGKSSNIVFADADIAAAAAAAPYAVFDNAGQDCCARSRILVQASVPRSSSTICSERSMPWSSPIHERRRPRWDH